MSTNNLENIRRTFQQNLASVDKLINFDREVQDFAINSVEDLHDRLKRSNLDNPKLNAERTLQVLRQIRENDSLRPRYETIFNQAVVLLVSYFGSAVGDIFRFGIARELKAANNVRLLREELRVSLEDILQASQNSEEALPEIFVLKKDISFQDMQSVHRAFEDYLNVVIERDKDINNIILGQACRHVIAHRGAVIDERLIRQVKGAKPRTLKQQLEEGEAVKFNTKEIRMLSESMSRYVDRLCKRLESQ
jgi:hypothetical protein